MGTVQNTAAKGNNVRKSAWVFEGTKCGIRETLGG